MMRILRGAALAGALASVSAMALPVPATAGAAETGPNHSQVCLNIQQIDHTKTPDDRTILFYMQDGKIWKNTLRNKCTGLTFKGFAYTPTPPNHVCGNMQTIRVIEFGSVCMMGAFEPYTPPPKEETAH